MLVTVEDAIQGKECCVDRSNLCVGSDCQGWRWGEKAFVEQVVNDGGSACDKVTAENPCPKPYDEQTHRPWADRIERILREKHLPVFMEDLRTKPPKGPGWTPNPEVSQGKWMLLVVWTRETDPDRRGYCGRAGTPYHME